MNADEMFKKADHRLEKGENYEIFKREVIGTNVIRFNYKSKTIVIMNTEDVPLIIQMEVVQAISEKCKELGWL